MTSSSSQQLERGLDTMVLVYSLLQGHPAELRCEQFLRSHSAWFTSPFVIAEAKHILTSASSRLNLGVAQTFLSVRNRRMCLLLHRQECLCHP